MRYRLRTLLILLAVGPPFAAWTWCEFRARQDEAIWQEALSQAKSVTHGPGLMIVPECQAVPLDNR
jgi:hypothetical protein